MTALERIKEIEDELRKMDEIHPPHMQRLEPLVPFLLKAFGVMRDIALEERREKYGTVHNFRIGKKNKFRNGLTLDQEFEERMKDEKEKA